MSSRASHCLTNAYNPLYQVLCFLIHEWDHSSCLARSEKRLNSPGSSALRAEHNLAFTPVLIYMSEMKVLPCLPLKFLNVTEIELFRWEKMWKCIFLLIRCCLLAQITYLKHCYISSFNSKLILLPWSSQWIYSVTKIVPGLLVDILLKSIHFSKEKNNVKKVYLE